MSLSCKVSGQTVFIKHEEFMKRPIREPGPLSVDGPRIVKRIETGCSLKAVPSLLYG